MVKYIAQFVKDRTRTRWISILFIILTISAVFGLFLHESALHDTVHTETTPSQNTNESTPDTQKSDVLPEVLSDIFPPIATPSTTQTRITEQSIHVQTSTSPSPVPLPSTPITTPNITAHSSIGVFAGTVQELADFERHIGTQVDIVATSVHWGNERDFPMAYAALMNSRNTTFLIYWYPMDYNKKKNGQDAFHFEHILDGSWDTYIDSFVTSARESGADIIIAPFEEANGTWTYWNGATGTYGTKDEYIETFRYLREKFRDVPNVRFAWVMNHVSVPDTQENGIATYYPGDAYVDIVGINAFNFGTPWLSFDTLVSSAIAETLPYHKPIYITSTACADDERKATWIQELFQSHFFADGSLEGFVWFNEHKERDWRVWSDAESETVFRNVVTKIQK